jgi:AraC-like DNA-binding protein
MLIEFTVHPSFNILTKLSQRLGVPVQGNRLILPPTIGDGYVKKIDIEPDFKFVMHHYTLKEPFHLRRTAPPEKNNLISIVFKSQEVPLSQSSLQEEAIQFLKANQSAIQIASSSIGTETIFKQGAEVYFGVVGLSPQRLSSLLNLERPNAQMATILSGEESFFYHESMTPEIERVLKQLSQMDEQSDLSHLLYRIKVQELLHHLFSKLMRRESEMQSPINKADIDKLYAIRTSIMTDITNVPHLPDLAKEAGMSVTKMKVLFKQVFGDTIYNYYQKIRMEEAAFLLKQGRQSVSEVGYRLGFSNLSHFSRLFQKHYGLTPKKYASAT